MGYLIDLEKRRITPSIGNKALNLHRLSRMGIRIPKTYVVSWDAYRRYLQDDEHLVPQLRLELQNHLKPDTVYAVRSSANIEDSVVHSFAGQFKSVLNIQGIDAAFQAIWSIWGTARTEQVEAYLQKHGIASSHLLMAVIIQEMVPPVFAGVALSRNPVTGADEIVVEAVKGSGDALVQAGVTPWRWINKWGHWILQPDSSHFPQQVVEQVVDETRLMTTKFKAHLDVEWVYDGRQLFWLQAREITTLNHSNVYSNHISKEMIPGMIKPLIASINIPLVCSMWVRLLTEMVGKIGVQPEELAKSFYYRVYFNMGTLGQIFEHVGFPADSVETLMGIFPDDVKKPAMKPTVKTFLRLPRMIGFLFGKWFFATRVRKALPEIERDFQAFDYQNAGRLDEKELLETIDRLYAVVQEAAYYNIVTPLLTMMYNRVLTGHLTELDVEFSQFDLTAGITEVAEYDPTVHLCKLHDQFILLDQEIQDQIRISSYDQFVQLPGIAAFQGQVADFLDRFGYLSDNGNDFSVVPWRETPDLVLDLIVNFVPTSNAKSTKIGLEDLDLRGLNRLKFIFFYKRARQFHLLRERIGAAYNHGYGLFRYYYLALGSHFVRHDWVDEPADIFYLRDEQIRELVNATQPSWVPRQEIGQHKTDIERFRNVALPTVIYGEEPPPIENSFDKKLIGVPTSLGTYTGKVTVVRGIRDFKKVREGDVLVIPYSDVGWTPLFARAGAVVAESGGMLSHSSIIAREYNIPAVVSVAGATNLPDNALVTVCGHSGSVFIHENGKQEQ